MTEGTAHNVHITRQFNHKDYSSSVPKHYFLMTFQATYTISCVADMVPQCRQFQYELRTKYMQSW